MTYKLVVCMSYSFMKLVQVSFFIILSFGLSKIALAQKCSQQQSIASITKVDGQVKFQRYQSIKTKSIRKGKTVLLCPKDKVITLENGQAKVLSKKGDVIILDYNSILTLAACRTFRP